MAASGGGGLLSGVGRFLGSPGGATAIQALGGLGAAAIGASGQNQAAEIQAKYLREALAYEKQRDAYLQNLEANRYGNLEQRLNPYMALGQGASERIGRMLGLNIGAPNITPAPTPMAQLPTYMRQRGPATPGGLP